MLKFSNLTTAEMLDIEVNTGLHAPVSVSFRDDPDAALAWAIERGDCPRCHGRKGRSVGDFTGCASYLKPSPNERWEPCAVCQDVMTPEEAEQIRAEMREMEL